MKNLHVLGALPHRPPLRALATFEAAARLGSFSAAAQELRLTPSAVSHQIIGLEDLLGIELFARVGRGIELTARGKQYLKKIQGVLGTLDEATRDIIHAATPQVVNIHTPPSIASKWLLPLLPDFIKVHPRIEVRVNAESGRASFAWSTTDLAILYAAPAGQKNCVPLLMESVQPMCSPAKLLDLPIITAQDLMRHVLIHTTANAVTWENWFTAQGLRANAEHERIQIDPSHVAIEAAVKEFGVVLESSVLARDELASGRLVPPLPDLSIRHDAYQLAWAPGRTLSPAGVLLRDWLLAAAGRASGKNNKKPHRR